MNKEVYYEGWLIKSPPTKRIWRARWRRRWFTLKQGEIPEQFCLEYYTDRNCRKLKGVIDLDQCEQVDCGLRLENRKQKFQFMFDIKTPKRTYYLAADTEADMRDWVNCICQVCHLHDTKQSNDVQQDENPAQNTASTVLSNSTNNTTTTSLNSSSSGALTASGTSIYNTAGGSRHSINNDLLRRPGGANVAVVDQQPQKKITTATYQNNNNSESAYVNAYSNRETFHSDWRSDRQPLVAAVQQPTSPPCAALYLNSPVFAPTPSKLVQKQPSSNTDSARLAINANGVVRKIPENLVLNNTPLPETKQHSIQPSPALSTASGPYIPISECFSGSPKFLLDGGNPTTPLNNLDPKFYDTPRSHNNIGLNLTNDQSYSPKITNCSLQQMSASKIRSQRRSDSDSESVFTDDEWTHPLPLPEANMDRSTRPSDSSIENESFVLTYSQRFSKMPDESSKEAKTASSNDGVATIGTDPLDKLARVLKNKNNLILDFKEQEKIIRELPQLSDTENTSPAIGPRDARSVVEESYDIPRSHNLPYYNMGQLLEKVTSPEANPIAASTPNLMIEDDVGNAGPISPAAQVRTLPRPHCYTNAAPSKVEGTVFRYDFIEQTDLPPVNRKLKPKVNIEDKPPEEVPAKPPGPAPAAGTSTAQQYNTPIVDDLAQQITANSIKECPGSLVATPPSVDRKSKPNAYKVGKSTTTAATLRRSTGGSHGIILRSECDTIKMESSTLPRQPRPHQCAGGGNGSGLSKSTASASSPLKNEYKLQYFDLDVANAPGSSRLLTTLSADPTVRVPVASSVVYNSVDFLKTEAFNRIREERKKETEGSGLIASSLEEKQKK